MLNHFQLSYLYRGFKWVSGSLVVLGPGTESCSRNHFDKVLHINTGHPRHVFAYTDMTILINRTDQIGMDKNYFIFILVNEIYFAMPNDMDGPSWVWMPLFHMLIQYRDPGHHFSLVKNWHLVWWLISL
jgi:hypothetical protein